MKAGAFTPAIPSRCCDGNAVDHQRSMKAGAFTPAIQGKPAVTAAFDEPLNEGGGFHPRNPCV